MGKEQIQTEATEKAPPSTVVEKPAPAIQKAAGPQPAERHAQEATTADHAQRVRRLAALQRNKDETGAGQQSTMPVQRKVEVGGPDDAYEREAHAMAEHVTNGAKSPPPQVSRLSPQRSSEPQHAEKKPAVQPAAAEEKRAPTAVSKLEADKSQAKGDDKTIQRLASDAAADDKIHRSPDRSVQRADAVKAQAEQTVARSGTPAPSPAANEKSQVQRAAASKPEAAAGSSAAKTQAPPSAPEKQAVQRAETKSPAAPTAATAAESKPLTDRPVAQREPRSATGGAESAGLADTAERAIASKGPGRPMNANTRRTLEDRMGTDLGHVRVHDDEQARQASKALNARAFTHQNDVWLGRGESDTDTQLMAHEATHVVQQNGSAQRLVQREPTDAATAAPAAATGTVDDAKKEIVIPNLILPPFKVLRHKDVYSGELVMPNKERDTKQDQVWKDEVKGDVGARVDQKLKDAQYVASSTSGQNVYFLKSVSAAADFYVFGTKEGIKSEVVKPYWDPLGRERLLEVDHRLEVQLGGDDKIDNMELLDSAANQSSGRNIDQEIAKRVAAATAPYTKQKKKSKPPKQPNQTNQPNQPAPATPVKEIWTQPPKVKDLRLGGWKIRFQSVVPGLRVDGEPLMYWKVADIRAGKHLDKLKVMTAAEIEQSGLRGSPTELVIFSAVRGGTPRRIALRQGAGPRQQVRLKNFYEGLDVSEVYFDPSAKQGDVVGSISGTVFNSSNLMEKLPVEWNIRRAPGIGYGGYIDDIGILNAIRRTRFEHLSPVEFTQARLDDQKGLYAVGKILPTVPLFAKIDIELIIEGNDIRLRKLFDIGDFSFPGPIQVTSSSLELSAGIASGLKVTGQVDFEIQRVGQGFLKGGVSTSSGFAVEGEFNFDSKLFDPARIRAWYRDRAFGAEGNLGIKEGKVKGIKSATIRATYGEGRLTATGNAHLSIPGVKEGSFSLSYSEAEGFAIGGSFQLADNIPGIKGGSIDAQVKQKPDGSGYDVKASGHAEPKIPGVNASVAVTYDNGALTIEGTAAYEKGMLKGSVLIGATNRPIGEDGRPAGEPGRTFKAYGGGTVTIKIAPWLQGTIGLKLKPNGEIEVSGSIGLPASLDIFPEKKLDKNIFKIGLDIPLFGVSVAGQRIGIFANITGGLDLSAGIGPGQLQELGLSVTYNPAHEDQTHVVGGAKLHIPAHAGLRLFVRGGLGVGIPIVSAQAGLEIGGQLGLEGAINAGVQIDWTPARGLVLDAHGEIYVEPKLKFDITGFVLVEADLLLTTIELYNKRWQLAGFEYGSGLRLGVKFPIHYEEGKPFDISLSDLQFEVPEIKPQEVLSDLVKKIA